MRLPALLAALLIAVVCAASASAALAASSSKLCKVVTVTTRVHGHTVRRRTRECESASLGAAPTSLPYYGATISFHVTSSNAARCTLAASPALWSGKNPAPVGCRSAYTLKVPSTFPARRWTVRLTARNRYGETVVVSRTISQAVDPWPVSGSDNWSGYALEGTAISGATGTFTVPNLAPTAGESDMSEWVGVDGYSNSDAIQAGVHEEYDPVARDVVISPWWEILPAPETPITPMSVSAGDRVTVQVAQVAGTTWKVAVLDATNGESFTSSPLTYTGPGTSAEWIVEAPSINNTPATLGIYSPAITFTGLAAGGNRVQIDELVMVQNGAIVSTPSALDPNGFTVAYGSTAPNAP
jgi:hypothetical protein